MPLELSILVAELYDFSRADKGEIKRPEENDLPHAGVGGIRNSLELFAVLK